MNKHITQNIIWSHNESEEEIFERIFRKNLWQSLESVSGKGSEIIATQDILSNLPILLQKYNIKTILDAPCGDFNWIKHLAYKFDKYIGIDIVEEIIANNKQYENNNTIFNVGNILNCYIPNVDLILCRDCFIHFTYKQIYASIKNFKKSQAKFILLTTYDIDTNHDIPTGQYRKINLLIPPLNFPKPLEVIREYPSNDNKYLALWKLEDLQ